MPLSRRSVVMAGAGLAAALAGVGVAWVSGHGSASAPPSPGGDGNFWQLEFDTPDGQKLPTQQFRGRPLLVNFWATWCPPCIEELPLLDRFHQEKKALGWQVLGLAVDQVPAVRRWLEAKPLSFPVAMAGATGTSLSRALGNLTGGLPFSAVFGAQGQLLHRKSGQVSESDLRNWASLK
ncbi:MAG: TlpA disulfide reductase family protein [Pseudomonadota bacterium]